MPAPGTRSPAARAGLAQLRRSGTISDLLLLYECLTEEPTDLKSIASRLGVTVQAVSHSFRQLARRGLAERRAGRYRPTVAGVEWLHAVFTSVRDDLDVRGRRLHVIRSTRALAASDLRTGEPVVLEMREGLLHARRGADGSSRGRVARSARSGGLVEIEALEGIVPIRPGQLRLLAISADQIDDPRTVRRLAGRLRRAPHAIVAAAGLEAFHLASRATARPVLRFGIAASAIEAMAVGLDVRLVVRDEDLPRVLASLAGPPKVPLRVEHLGAARA